MPVPTNVALILLTPTQPWVTPKRAPTPFPSEVTHESG
jgi:hypothetical protein